VYQAFFGKTSQADLDHHYREAHPLLVVPLAVTAVISVVIGTCPGFFMRFIHLIV
jgi:NADH:ubiquinone oxidoreductase subunit 5 (subunit L)/multisubunit Na+/H+ antiporter MnhA subunit